MIFLEHFQEINYNVQRRITIVIKQWCSRSLYWNILKKKNTCVTNCSKFPNFKMANSENVFIHNILRRSRSTTTQHFGNRNRKPFKEGLEHNF